MVNKTTDPAAKYYPQITFVNMLQILFIGLKLTEQIDWSWALVLLPIIIETGLVVVGLVLVGVANYIDKKERQVQRQVVWDSINKSK